MWKFSERMLSRFKNGAHSILSIPLNIVHTEVARIVAEKGMNPEISWIFLEKNISDVNPITQICKLCIREKLKIVLNPSVASLNHRSEMFGCCRHKRIYLMGDPPV